MTTIVLRIILTSLIIYMAYLETGFYTTLCIAFISVSLELHTRALIINKITTASLLAYLKKENNNE